MNFIIKQTQKTVRTNVCLLMSDLRVVMIDEVLFMNKYKFIKKVEAMIKTDDIAILRLMGPLLKYVPGKFQAKALENSSKDNPYLGFVVEPYSTFLFYELIDLKWAQRLIPDGFELEKTKVFADGEAKYYIAFAAFNVKTSAFAGTRLEVNIIARSKSTGLISWIIVDYDTNTLSHDSLKGVIDYTTKETIFTTDYDGNIIVDINNPDKKRTLIVDLDSNDAQYKQVEREFWLEGNLSVGYGREISKNSPNAFAMKFDPKEVEKAYRVELNKVNMIKNTWYPGLFNNQIDEALYFPFAQHYLSDSPGNYSKHDNVEAMIREYQNLDLDSIPPYSAESLRNIIKIGLISNSIVIALLLVSIGLLLNR